MIKLAGEKVNVIHINDIDIPDVREVTISIETPSDNRGIFREPTIAVTITITRDASDNAIGDLFQLATNGDGRKKIITGELGFVSDELENPAIYNFKIVKAFISKWVLDNPSSTTDPATEMIELKVGEIDFTDVAGGSAKFMLKHFN